MGVSISHALPSVPSGRMSVYNPNGGSTNPPVSRRTSTMGIQSPPSHPPVSVSASPEKEKSRRMSMGPGPLPQKSHASLSMNQKSQVSLKKSPSMQVSAMGPTRGKPRIFAAMEEQEQLSPTPPPPPPSEEKQKQPKQRFQQQPPPNHTSSLYPSFMQQPTMQTSLSTSSSGSPAPPPPPQSWRGMPQAVSDRQSQYGVAPTPPPSSSSRRASSVGPSVNRQSMNVNPNVMGVPPKSSASVNGSPPRRQTGYLQPSPPRHSMYASGNGSGSGDQSMTMGQGGHSRRPSSQFGNEEFMTPQSSVRGLPVTPDGSPPRSVRSANGTRGGSVYGGNGSGSVNGSPGRQLPSPPPNSVVQPSALTQLNGGGVGNGPVNGAIPRGLTKKQEAQLEKQLNAQQKLQQKQGMMGVPPQTPPRTRKLSKVKPVQGGENGVLGLPNPSNTTLSSSPESHRTGSHRLHKHSQHLQAFNPNASASNLSVASGVSSKKKLPEPLVLEDDKVDKVDEQTMRNAGIELDDDPFAKNEGVRMLKPTQNGAAVAQDEISRASGSVVGDESDRKSGVNLPLTPVSQEEKGEGEGEGENVGEEVGEEEKPREPRPDAPTMAQFLSNPTVLANLLSYFTFYDWCVTAALSREIRVLLVRTPELREDLSDYMRGVSTPTHEYARVAGMYSHSLTVHPTLRDPSILETVRSMTSSTRAYTRVVLRLRAQAEKEAAVHQANLQSLGYFAPPSAAKNMNFASPTRGNGTSSRVSSRAPSPTMSNYSQSQSHGYAPGMMQNASSSQPGLAFRSPLFKLRRAPLLRVFVPSPEGDWLSDKSVLECEAECKRAGVQHLMRLGDVVWDVAVGDEGNVG
ncbi:hypothetical protein CVT24_005432, partial [Panaeolus cyanescens]